MSVHAVCYNHHMKRPLPPTVILGADHAGFMLKESLIPWLVEQGAVIEDATPTSHEHDDYPPVAKEVAQRVTKHPGSFGVLLCGTGVGMCIGANRIHGVRAVLAMSKRIAIIAREHNHANILCLGGRTMTSSEAIGILDAFLNAREDKSGRHLRRVRELS